MKFIKHLPLLVTLALPLAAPGQLVTVFQDNFQNGSTLNPATLAAATPTANKTGYQVAAGKNVTAGTTISSGSLTFGGWSTGVSYGEIAALFTNAPITLNTAGQYVEFYYTFTATTSLFNGNATNGEQINCGLYYSGGVPPTNGSTLWNSGLTSSATSATNGGTKGWVGYSGMFAYSPNSTNANGSQILNRPASTLANNLDQEIGPGNSGLAPALTNLMQVNPTPTGPAPAFTVGNQYTMDLQITYVNATTLAITNTLYNGAGNTGSVVSGSGFTGQFGLQTTKALTYSLDGLCMGFRPATTPTTAESLQINKVTVLEGIPTAPIITGLTNQTLVTGGNLVLNPVISAVPAAGYQWQTNGVNITGATSASLTVSGVTFAQNGYVYSLIATNSLGLTTNSMTLTVTVPPAITGLYSQSGTVGDTVTISPTVSGSPTPVDRWQYNGADLAEGLDSNGSTLSGTATASLSIANAQAADSGTYSLIASNSAGLVTNSMTLTVSAGNVAPTISGLANQTIVQGNNATFSATVSGVPVPGLQWLDQTGTPISGATGSSLTLTNVQYSQNGFAYSLVATNSAGSQTNSAMLYVLVPVAITNQPVSRVVTNTQAASFTVVAGGVPSPAYQWYFNGSALSGATAATYALGNASPANIGSYYVVVTNGVNSVTSSVVTLTVNSTLGYSTLKPANAATGVCYDTPLYLTFSAPPVLRASGTVKIYNVTNALTPVDTLNLALNLTNNATYAANVQAYTIGGTTFTNFPVIISGTNVAIYPHHGVLTSNQTYYVTIDPGVFTDSNGAYFSGINSTNVWRFTTKPGGPANPTNVVVAQDYSGDFATVQGAVDAVAANNTTPTLINLRNGLYTEVVNILSKNNLTIRGQTRTGTVISYANNANLQGSTHARMNFRDGEVSRSIPTTQHPRADELPGGGQ